MASSAAREDFFSHYAVARSLNRTAGRTSLPPSTPLLRKGDRRYAEQVMNGTLPGGAPGAIGLYTYETETTDSEGNDDTDYYRYTVVLHDLPAVAVKVSGRLLPAPRGLPVHGLRRGRLPADAAARARERGPRQALRGLLRRQRRRGLDEALFSPSFIVWLTEQTPKNFAFEFSAGSLCVNVKGQYDNAAELDALCEAAGQVARRLAGEASE